MSAVDTLRNALFGNPPAPDYKPSREGTLQAFSILANSLEMVVGGITDIDATAVYETQAELFNDLVHDSRSLGLVYDDTIPSRNGIYIKSGTSGFGGWTATGLLGIGLPGTPGSIGPQGPGPTDEQLQDAFALYVATLDALVDQSEAARDAAQIAAQTVTAMSRYFATRALGEAGSTTGQYFSTNDGAGSIIFYQKTSGGSTEIARMVTPATLLSYVTKLNASLTGAVSIATNGSRVGITSDATPLVPTGLIQVINKAVSTAMRVSSYWTAAGGVPFQNRDDCLFEVFNKITESSLNQSWGLSVPNGYNDIPAGVHDTGERVGVYGWAVSVNIPGQYEHKGRLRSQIGVRGRAGFQGDATLSPAGAMIDQAIGVRGEIRNDSPLAEIGNAFAGQFESDPVVGIVQNNYALYANAIGGIASNWSFHGANGEMYNKDRVFFGEDTIQSRQSNCAVTIRGPMPNAVEFGNGDPGGYGSNLGATGASGYPFLAFNAEASTGNTFRTRGKVGRVVWADLNGALVFSRVANANAHGQSLTDDGFFDNAGRLRLNQPVILASQTPASATASGTQGQTVWDENYLYVCVADNVWKRTALTTW